jgi:peptide deformylase
LSVASLVGPLDPVVEFDDDLQLLLADMFVTPTSAGPANLTAPQVGDAPIAFVFGCLVADLERQVGVVCKPVVEVSVAHAGPETWVRACSTPPTPAGTTPPATPGRAPATRWPS